MKKILFAGAALMVAFGSQAASAATIISCGGASSCITETDNVLLDSATNVAVGTGLTNTTPGVPIEFTSTTDMLNLDASGQATISAVDEILNNLTFTLLGGAIWSWLLGRHPATVVAPFTLLVPVFGFLGSAVLLGEPLQGWKLAASGLVVAGLGLNLFGPRLFNSRRR